MTEELHRPTIRLSDDGVRWLDEPPTLLSRLTLTMAVFDTQTRAELHQWWPEGKPTGQLIWQHHAPIPAVGPNQALQASTYLAATVDYLAVTGWACLKL